MKNKIIPLLIFIIFPVFAETEDIHEKIKKLKNELEILGETQPVFVWGGDPVSIKGNCIKLQAADIYKAYPKYGDKVFINGEKCKTTNTFEADDLDDELVEKESAISTDEVILRKKINNTKSSKDKSSLLLLKKELKKLEKQKLELKKARSSYEAALKKYKEKANKAYSGVESKIEKLRQKLFYAGDIIDAKDTLPDV